MSKIIDIDSVRPHDVRYATCLKCGHDWVAVVPSDCIAELECPRCSTVKGWLSEMDRLKMNHENNLARIVMGHKIRMWILAASILVPTVAMFVWSSL